VALEVPVDPAVVAVEDAVLVLFVPLQVKFELRRVEKAGRATGGLAALQIPWATI
jgi:hypothetical protein